MQQYDHLRSLTYKPQLAGATSHGSRRIEFPTHRWYFVYLAEVLITFKPFNIMTQMIENRPPITAAADKPKNIIFTEAKNDNQSPAEAKTVGWQLRNLTQRRRSFSNRSSARLPRRKTHSQAFTYNPRFILADLFITAHEPQDGCSVVTPCK